VLVCLRAPQEENGENDELVRGGIVVASPRSRVVRSRSTSGCRRARCTTQGRNIRAATAKIRQLLWRHNVASRSVLHHVGKRYALRRNSVEWRFAAATTPTQSEPRYRAVECCWTGVIGEARHAALRARMPGTATMLTAFVDRCENLRSWYKAASGVQRSARAFVALRRYAKKRGRWCPRCVTKTVRPRGAR